MAGELMRPSSQIAGSACHDTPFLSRIQIGMAEFNSRVGNRHRQYGAGLAPAADWGFSTRKIINVILELFNNK